MAASRNINLLIDCLICGLNRTDRTPRLLACKHGFCQECLLQTSSIQREGKLQCPVCLDKTQLSNNGVFDLKVDTTVASTSAILLALKDHFTCALCILKAKKKEAVARCTNCEFRLCHECVKDHKTKPMFSTHAIVEKLCKIHIRDLSRACLTCRTGMCYECILSGFHDYHDTCDITELKEKAIVMMDKGKHRLEEEIGCVDKLMNETMDESMKRLTERRNQTEEKLENYRKKMMEAITTCLDKREEEFNRFVTKVLENQNEACSQASNCLNEINMVLKGGKIDILEQLTEKTCDIFRSLNTLCTAKEVLIRVPELEEDQCTTNANDQSLRIEFTCALGRINSEMALVEKPTKILELKKLCGKDKPIENLYHIAALADGSAVLGLIGETYAVQINDKGDIIAEFHTQSGSCVRGVDTYRGEIFLLSNNPLTITRFKGTERQVIGLTAGPSYVWDLAIDANSFLFTNNLDKVYQYSHEGAFLKKFAKDKEYQYRISLGEHPVFGKVYLVSADTMVCVHKPEGDLVRTVGGTDGGETGIKFKHASGSTMLPNNHILITDTHMHTVTEVTCEGEFVRYLLTQKDGVNRPTGVSFNYPYLWVACREAVLLFKYA